MSQPSGLRHFDSLQPENDHEIHNQHVLSFLNFKTEDMNDQSFVNEMNQNSDDADGEVKRPLQTASEKKRRDMIKTGYDKLAQMCLRGCSQTETSKLSHANILTRASAYIDSLENDIKSLREEKAQIERDLVAAGTMKHICSSVINSNNSETNPRSVSQVQAFAVFREVMDRLYDSFRQYVCMDNFPRLAETLLKWAELYCTPHFLHQFAENSLVRVRTAVTPLFRSS